MSRLEFECHPDGLFMVFLDDTSVIVTCIECETEYSWRHYGPQDQMTPWKRLRARWRAWRILRRTTLEGDWMARLKAVEKGHGTSGL